MKAFTVDNGNVIFTNAPTKNSHQIERVITIMNNITIYSYISPLGLYWFRMRKYFIYEQRSTADFTCAILCGDGYLDTIADIRAGFKPIWGSEIYEQRQVFTDLTNGDDLSDTIRSTMKVRIGFTMSNQDSLAQIKFLKWRPQRSQRKIRMDICHSSCCSVLWKHLN